MKKIIIPTELNDKAEKSLRGAITIALKLKLGIEILHVIDSFDYGINFVINESSPIMLPPDTLDGKRDEAIELFNNLLSKIKNDYELLPTIQLNIKTGFIMDVISESIEDPSCFMAIINDKTQLDYNYRDISKENSKIIQSSNCPVCILPNEAPFNEPKKIIYATNFQEQDIPNITNLANFASAFDATIYVVHVSNQPEFDEQIKIRGLESLVKNESAYEKIKFRTVKSHDFLVGIDNYANEKDVDMIAVMRENKTIFQAFFAANHARKIIYKTNLPVIVYQELED